MPVGPRHEVVELRSEPGELSFEARIGGRAQRVWMRTETPLQPTADAALPATLMLAMREGGTLTLGEPVSARVLRTQREFQAIQRAWSLEPEFGTEPLRGVEVAAPAYRPSPGAAATGRVATFFSGGVDSWASVLDNPDVTDLIFVRGMDLVPGAAHQLDLAGEIEQRLREASGTLGLALHVVETNLRELSDSIIPWDNFYGCAAVAVAHFLSPLFERVLIAGDSDYEVQAKFGANLLVDQLWSSERLEIVDDGGRFSRMQRLARIAEHPAVQSSLRVCWHNTDGAYNCGRCRKCLMTMVGLEALGRRERFRTFPNPLDLEAVAAIELRQSVLLTLWEDLLDATRAAGRPDLEEAVAAVVSRGKRLLGLPATYRRRRTPGAPPTVRIGVVIPAWGQSRYLAGAIQSALDQEIETGVGVVVVNDGCPDPETDRIGQAMRDAHPDRVSYLRQTNRGLPAARNAGIRQAIARWPHIEAIFPLDADNLLSAQTLDRLSAELDRHPGAAWATPVLEIFGEEEGQWRIPGPYLPYRQLLANQCDAGSLVRREVFAAGIDFDETMRDGFEDWEFFLRATLAGFGGAQAGACGFRYRRHDSMLAAALPQAARLEAEIRRRHPKAYAPVALAEREHAEAPRFALVRCDRDDVLLTAGAALEPHRLGLPEFAQALAAGPDRTPPFLAHIPAMTVLTSAAQLERLDAVGELANLLERIQGALAAAPRVGLGGSVPGELANLAIRASGLARLGQGPLPAPDLTIPGAGAAGGEISLPLAGATRAAALIGAAAIERGAPLSPHSHSSFLEHWHIDLAPASSAIPIAETAAVARVAA